MKVALCIFGHFRCFDKCYQNLLNNIINVYHPDVFAQAWVDSTGTFLHPYVTPDAEHHPGYDVQSPKPSIDYIKGAISILNPVDVHLDHYYLHDKRFADIAEKYKDFKSTSPNHRPKGSISMNWSRHASISMKNEYEKANGFKYDYVIVTRYDNQHTSTINLKNFDPNTLAVPDTHQLDNLIGDICIIGGSDIIGVLGDQINNIDKLVEAGIFNLCPHVWMQAWIEYNNIPWEHRGDMGVWTDR